MNNGCEFSASERKVFVLGLDGVPFELLQAWIGEGKLPTFKMLVDNGISGDLQSTIPPLTVPAWPAMLTGKNPGQLGVFGFLQRAEDGYSSRSANLSWKTWNPIWDVISEAGKTSFLVNIPSTVAPDGEFNGIFIPGGIIAGGQKSAYPNEIQIELEKRGYRGRLRGIRVLGKDKFLTEVDKIIYERHKLVLDLISRDNWDFFMSVFFYTDLVLHNFTKYIDKRHPEYEENRKYSQTVLNIFQKIDRYILEILEALPLETNTLIVSDHGMGVLHKDIDLNAWLAEEDFMTLKDGNSDSNLITLDGFKSLLSHPWLRNLCYHLINVPVIGSLKDRIKGCLPRTDRSWKKVDWPRTEAYCIGWNGIFINLKGREPYGVVEEGAQYERIRDRLIERLRKLYDPEYNQLVVQNIWRKEEIYQGPYLDILPDLVIEFLGDSSRYIAHSAEAAPGDNIFVPSKLSGGHTKHGTFIGYGPDIEKNVEIENVRIFDIAPNILHMLNVPIPEDMDGKVLRQIFKRDSPLSGKPVEYQEPKIREPAEMERYSAKEEETIKERLKDLGYL